MFDQGAGVYPPFTTRWICDVFVAYEELRQWLGEEGQTIAAVSFGYAHESPNPRSRNAVSEVTRYA
jgi:hypothetical protein